ncbi:unnamed protein product, partial [Ectocarpus sp. 12 AP-2014]
AGEALSSALRETTSVEQKLQNEALERNRLENKAQRLRGALRHLLADGESLDCSGPVPNSTQTSSEQSRNGCESGPKSHHGSSSVDYSGQAHR